MGTVVRGGICVSLLSLDLSCEVAKQKDVNTDFGSMQFLTSKVYLYITTVQSESLACKIGVLHIYNRYTIIYYNNKTKTNKKTKQENNLFFLNTLSFLQFSQHFYKTRKKQTAIIIIIIIIIVIIASNYYFTELQCLQRVCLQCVQNGRILILYLVIFLIWE